MEGGQPFQGTFQGSFQGPQTGAPAFGPSGSFSPAYGQFGPPTSGGVFSPTQFFQQPPPNSTPQTQNTQGTANQTMQIADGIAKLDQLRTIQTGISHYTKAVANAFHQTAPLDRFGPMIVQLDINFGNRTVGGGNSLVRVQNGLTGGPGIDVTLPFTTTQSFSAGIGDAVFTVAGSGLTATFSIKNAGGVIAAEMKADASYQGAGGKVGTGTIDNIPIAPNAS